MSVSVLVAVDSLYSEHREMNASESTVCSILCYVSEVEFNVFLRSSAGGRWMMHANNVSGLQASLTQLKLCESLNFSSHFIWRSFWMSIGKSIWEGRISKWDQRSIEDFVAAEVKIRHITVSQALSWSCTSVLWKPELGDSLNPRRADFFFPDMCTTTEGTPRLAQQKLD